MFLPGIPFDPPRAGIIANTLVAGIKTNFLVWAFRLVFELATVLAIMLLILSIGFCTIRESRGGRPDFVHYDAVMIRWRSVLLPPVDAVFLQFLAQLGNLGTQYFVLLHFSLKEADSNLLFRFDSFWR